MCAASVFCRKIKVKKTTTAGVGRRRGRRGGWGGLSRDLQSMVMSCWWFGTFYHTWFLYQWAAAWPDASEWTGQTSKSSREHICSYMLTSGQTGDLASGFCLLVGLKVPKLCVFVCVSLYFRGKLLFLSSLGVCSPFVITDNTIKPELLFV